MSSAPPYLFWKSLPLIAVAALSVCGMHRFIEATTPHPNLEFSAAPAPLPSADTPLPFLQKWCYDCHGKGAAKGDFVMDGPEALTASDFDKIRRHVLLRTMPPENKPAPSPEARDAFEQTLLTWQATQPNLNEPAPFRRLSRREFANSLADLTGLAPALTDLPEEESAHGFDNNGDFQPLPPTSLERYVSVIRNTLRSALLPVPVPSRLQRFMASELDGPGLPSPDAPQFYEIESNLPTRLPLNLATAGSYRITLIAYAHQAGEDPVLATLMETPAQPVRSTDRTAPERLTSIVNLPAGPINLTFKLANPLHNPSDPNPHRRTRRLLVAELALEGPLEGDTTPTPTFTQRFGPLPAADASLTDRVAWAGNTIDSFARRAWRRPATSAESFRLTSLAGEAIAHGLRNDEVLTVALQAILTSPHFLFLANPTLADRKNRPYTVAARLSHLLWSTLPDENLLAECATAWTPARLAATALHLLEDPRATAFARDFAGQWLQLRNTTLSHPDNTLFPEATTERRAAMQENAEAFFLHLVRSNQPVLRLIDGDNTLLSSSLRQGDTNLPDLNQRGLLGQPAVLLLTSYPNRTSPVLRGKYILETLLGLDPPPPPPNVPTLLLTNTPGHAPQSVRETLERHHSDRSCAACHRAIDPLGFPLEAFDAIGRPSGAPTADLTATTFTGTTLHSPADLQVWLIENQGLRIVNHASERLLTYALGRGLSAAETQTAHRLVADCGGRQARFRDLLLAVISSPLFRGEVK